MNAHDHPETFGTVTEPATLTLRRRLPGPIDRVWRYLTDADLRRQWLADGAMPPEEGAAFELVWRNDDLSASPASRPSGFPAEQRMVSRVIAIAPPRRLVIAWGASGEVAFDLKEIDGAVLLTIVHRRIADRVELTQVAGGWHMHLRLLAACLAGTTRPSFWEGWQELRDAYDRRLPD